MKQDELIVLIGEVWEAVGQVLEISRQVLEAIERTEERLAQQRLDPLGPADRGVVCDALATGSHI